KWHRTDLLNRPPAVIPDLRGRRADQVVILPGLDPDGQEFAGCQVASRHVNRAVDFGSIGETPADPRPAVALSIDQHVELATDERIAELEGNLLLQFHELIAAGIFHFVGKVAVELY